LSELVRDHLGAGGMTVVTSHQPVPLAGGTAVDL